MVFQFNKDSVYKNVIGLQCNSSYSWLQSKVTGKWENADVRMYFLLLLSSREDVSLIIICLNVLKGIKQFYLSMWFKKERLETPFKGDNVKALIKTSNCENLVFHLLRKFRKLQHLLSLLCFQWSKNCLKMVLASPMIRNTHVTL